MNGAIATKEAQDQTKELRARLDEIRHMNPRDLEGNIDGLDWEQIAKVFVPTRSAFECRQRWLNEDHPAINHGPWTKPEDEKLAELAKRHALHHWDEIAREVGTNRTPFECLVRFQRQLNQTLLKSRWTEHEDEILTEAVRYFGEKNWQQVANCLEGRTGQQCLHRWQKTLNPRIRRGTWTPEEDEKLREAVALHGQHNWVKVAQHTPGRTDVQCRERWVNILDPELNTGPWTPEEDQQLMAKVAEIGPGKWALVAAVLDRRTDNQCWRRWKVLVHAAQMAAKRAATAAKKDAGKKRRRKNAKTRVARKGTRVDVAQSSSAVGSQGSTIRGRRVILPNPSASTSSSASVNRGSSSTSTLTCSGRTEDLLTNATASEHPADPSVGVSPTRSLRSRTKKSNSNQG